MDQHGSEIGIATFAHAEQVLLASTGVMSRHKSQPRCQLAPVVEILRMADRGYQCRGRERPDPRYLLQTLAGFAVAMPSLDLVFNLVDLTMQHLQTVEQPGAQETERARQFIAGIFDEFRHTLRNVGDALWHDQSKFAQQAADLVGLRRAGFDKP